MLGKSPQVPTIEKVPITVCPSLAHPGGLSRMKNPQTQPTFGFQSLLVSICTGALSVSQMERLRQGPLEGRGPARWVPGQVVS